MRKRTSVIMLWHYIRLFYRSALFLWAVFTWFSDPALRSAPFGQLLQEYRWLFFVIWAVLAVEMAARFFPSHLESMGCQKQFAANYIPAEEAGAGPGNINRGLPAVILSWTALNGCIGALHFAGVLPDGVLILIALFYSVCDLICILFFCPFQSWMMKNRCCTTCRIYNWDYPMMCTPLLFLPSVYTWSLCALALCLLLRWELNASRHPERFSVRANAGLRCENCAEKLCRHKKQLHALWKHLPAEAFFQGRGPRRG